MAPVSEAVGLPHHALKLPPDVTDDCFFTPSQWTVWYALMDAVIPSIVPGDPADSSPANNEYRVPKAEFDSYYKTVCDKVTSPPSREEFEQVLRERPSDNQRFKQNMVRTLGSLPKEMTAQIASVLNLLATRWLCYPLTGYFQPVHELPIASREALLKSWHNARLATFRGLAKSVSMLAQRAWIMTSPLLTHLVGWSEVPKDYKSAEKPAQYQFRQFSAGTEPETIETDVVIVGSGCGGGVCARNLAEAGYKVLVVEKGYHYAPHMLPMSPEVGEWNLFEDHGLLGTSDGGMTILAGATWGGGGTVNWGVSLKTPDYVREEWAKKKGMPLFTSPEFQQSLDRVCDFMGVNDAHVRQNHRSERLLEGCKKLGYKAKVTPHNSGNKKHFCGHCHLGCGSSGKQGPAVSWLPAAAKAGAQFIEGLTVERVTFDDFASGKKATGIVGKWVSRDKEGGLNGPLSERTTRDVVIKAKKVIISAGTIWSPVILRKSGLSNPQIGRNLYLHPVNVITGFWQEETNPWEGCAISSVCTEFENLDGEGHGTKLEPLCMIPFLALANYAWRSGIDFKLSALRYRHMGTFFSMPRDRDTGYVYPDPKTGKPKVDYTPSAFDRAHGLEGLIALARILFVTGAYEIRPSLVPVEPFLRSPPESGIDDSERFEKWLAHLRKEGNPATSPWGCAHQMGSCRMSKSADEGVVDTKGKVWGFEGLYVADASVFPSASGVNPMVTAMAISDHTSRGIIADMKALGI
ncbi:GMC oxidoreductase [Microdochium trichocladiopsis]|uniref:Long-chain-alcohol oxidase n=1 Tax=Microdochium trichocladiopsis TaxID=1682393 RepID=A0A9P8XUF8_9PEZI|nr:GMC oxidoreductase [Microdochium trichocladiopsis]KAH7018575.1 GMC oxidoreductase [Microdochium trichocladiopsis]